MTKYYRVRSQKQWDWLKNKLEIEDDLHVSNFPVTILYDDVICGIYRYHDDPEPLIEVSQMMEDEKMENEDYVTIKCEDLEKVHWETNYGRVSFINHDKNGEKYAHEQFLPANLSIPKSLLQQQKVKMTQAEKDEFDKLKDEISLNRHDLDDLLTRIKDSEDFPLLYHRLYVADGDGVESQLEFARAWADPSLIEVVKEPKYNVQVKHAFGYTPPFYKKVFGEKISDVQEVRLDTTHDLLNEDAQFTKDEIKQFNLEDCEKVEVKE